MSRYANGTDPGDRSGGRGTVASLASPSQRMRVFDSLPRRLRNILNNSRVLFSVEEIDDALRSGRFTTNELIRSIQAAADDIVRDHERERT